MLIFPHHFNILNFVLAYAVVKSMNFAMTERSSISLTKGPTFSSISTPIKKRVSLFARSSNSTTPVKSNEVPSESLSLPSTPPSMPIAGPSNVRSISETRVLESQEIEDYIFEDVIEVANP
jgi:hypothetical protein